MFISTFYFKERARGPLDGRSDHIQYNPPKDTGRRVLRQVGGLNLSNRCLLRSVSPSGSLTRTSTDSSTTVGIPLGRLPDVFRRQNLCCTTLLW